MHHPLESEIAVVPHGAWAVGVSGGADSVALLRLLLTRDDLKLHVVHLDHQTRGEQSDGDAEFTRNLATQLNLPCTTATRGEIETTRSNWPANASAFYRALRHALYLQVVQRHQLKGVLLAHHRDDQAETIFQRLLRASGPAGLVGMQAESRVRGLSILRPLLHVPAAALREFLNQIHQPWREDASNASAQYQRNRVRRLLAKAPHLTPALLHLSDAMQPLASWVRETAALLPPEFPVSDLADQPAALAQESARRWLAERGVRANEIIPAVIDRLILMATDAASSPRQHFPGKILVARRSGKIISPAELPRAAS